VAVETGPVLAVEADDDGAGVVGVAAATPGLGWFNIVMMTALEMPCCRR